MPLRPPAGFISANYDPLKNPNAPTGVSASGGDAQASVSFTAPTNTGGSAITAYYAVSNPGQITSSGTSSPVTVTGLSNGTAYTFQVWALNSFGPGPFSAASGSVTPAAARGVFGGGNTDGAGNTYINVIQYITISTTGNSTDFGDLTVSRRYLGACSSATRGVFAGGRSTSPPTFNYVNTIDYITIASTGNATDFGDLGTVNADTVTGCSSETRGLFAGFNGNVIEYITIATTGNSVDFGDFSANRYSMGACSSPTRGLFGGGQISGVSNVIDYVTIASTGNATDFGDLTVARTTLAANSSSTRAVFGGGFDTDYSNVIDYVTIASAGNATDFGDLTVSRQELASCSSSVRGCWGGGSDAGFRNVIDYVTIATAGNATDFGDLANITGFSGCARLAGCSSAHGGL
jgi:hypothetical protein